MIPYENPDLWYTRSMSHEFVMTDGTFVPSENNYTVSSATITVTNDILDIEKFKLFQSLCSEKQLTFGSCESGFIEFTIYDNIPTLKNKVLNVYVIPNHQPLKNIQLGIFKVTEDKITADSTEREIKAYDRMYDIINADVADWYNSVLPDSSSSMTLLAFRTSFFNYLNIPVETATLINDNITITRTIEPKQLSGGDVIKKICEINGTFGTITNEGKFRFLSLTPNLDSGLLPSDTLYPDDDLYPESVSYTVTPITRSEYFNAHLEDYTCDPISKLTIKMDSEDVGVTVGTGDNHYIISDNFLVFGKDQSTLTAIATNVFNKINNCYYTPCNVELKGTPLTEVGDGVIVSTKYRSASSYILQRELNGVVSFTESYKSGGVKTYNEDLNSVSSQFKQIAGKYSKLNAELEHITLEVGDLSRGVSSLQISVEGITESVSDLSGDLQAEVSLSNTRWSTTVKDGEISSKISAEAGQITLSSNRLVIHSTNFQLEANGDATFSGTVSGATITGGTLTSTGTDPDSDSSTTTITGGTITTDYLSLNNGKLRNINQIRFRSRTSWMLVGTDAVTVGTDIFQSEITYIEPSNSRVRVVKIDANRTSPSISLQHYSDSSKYVTIDTSGINISGHNVLTDASDVLTSTSEISASKITSGKMGSNVTYPTYINCQLRSNIYTLHLQTININGTDYLIYAGTP